MEMRQGPITDYSVALVVAGEQAAIARFGAGSHAAAYDARFPDAPAQRR